MEATASGNGVWPRILASIRENCTEQQFQTWFSRLTPASLDNGKIELLVPNQFLKETKTC